VGSLDARFDLARFNVERTSKHPRISRIVIFAPTQLLESEGQRGTNLAFEFARVGIPVVFCYYRWERSLWTVQERIEEGILQYPMDVAVGRPAELFPPSSSLPSIALFEFPHPHLFRVAATAHASGWVTVYDAIDDWEGFCRAGQAPWYDREFERHMARTSDLVLAVNRRLVEHMSDLGRSGAHLVPNGVPAGMGEAQTPRALRRGDVTVGYFGHLSSSWFDWDLVLAAARARPAWKWYIIGYGGERIRPDLPENVALIGKVRQSDLSAYAANWDVGIIPFRRGRVAAGADAIKLYEYMAMGLPAVVVGAPLPVMPDGLALEAHGLQDFLRALEVAARTKSERKEDRFEFAAASSWSARAAAIFHLIESGAQRVGEKLSMFGELP
jgi:glycosyltransferase involved in cell wall biosynthesis